jgi:outer membrane murein-binding lipoprotein Lpp
MENPIPESQGTIAAVLSGIAALAFSAISIRKSLKRDNAEIGVIDSVVAELQRLTAKVDSLEKKLEELTRKHRKSQDDAMDIYVLASMSKNCEQCVKVKEIAHNIISE